MKLRAGKTLGYKTRPDWIVFAGAPGSYGVTVMLVSG
jgi:hypothetical protein